MTSTPDTDTLRAELGAIGARLAEIRGLSPWEPTPRHPVHGAEVSRLNRRSVQIIAELENAHMVPAPSLEQRRAQAIEGLS